MKNDNEMTDKDRMFMWYTIALQALYELDRPLLLNIKFVQEIVDGKWEAVGSRTDDGGYLYKIQGKEAKDVQIGSQRQH